MTKQNKLADLSQMLGVRLEVKQRYLLELAARKAKCINTEIVKAALDLFLAANSPYHREAFEEATPGTEPLSLMEHEANCAKAETELKAHSFAVMSDLLWSESVSTRLRLLAGAFPYLLNEADWKQLEEMNRAN